MTGTDPMAGYRTYDTKDEARALMDANGGLEAMVAGRLGAEILPIAARVGDVGLHLVLGMPSLALKGGAHWLSAGPGGVVTIRSASVTKAWRV